MLRRRCSGQRSFDVRDDPNFPTSPRSSRRLKVFSGPYFRPPLTANHGRAHGRVAARGNSRSDDSLDAIHLSRLRPPPVEARQRVGEPEGQSPSDTFSCGGSPQAVTEALLGGGVNLTTAFLQTASQ